MKSFHYQLICQTTDKKRSAKFETQFYDVISATILNPINIFLANYLLLDTYSVSLKLDVYFVIVIKSETEK